MHGSKPYCVKAEALNVVQLRPDAVQIAGPVIVRIAEGADEYLVDSMTVFITAGRFPVCPATRQQKVE